MGIPVIRDTEGKKKLIGTIGNTVVLIIRTGFKSVLSDPISSLKASRVTFNDRGIKKEREDERKKERKRER